MFKRGLLSAVAAVAMTLGAAGAGHAGVITWTISNGVFDDGGTLSGTFSIDTNTGEATAYDLVSTPGADGSFPGLGGAPGPTQFGTEYTPAPPNAWFGGVYGGGYPTFGEAVYVNDDPDTYYFITSELDLTSLPGAGGGTYSLAGSSEGLFFDAEFPTGVSRTLVSGVAVSGAVPEPATWAMLILGVGLIGCAARRRNAGVAVAA